MTLIELRKICDDGIERGFGELPVAATINPEASMRICDLAYGDIHISGPHFTGKVFGITAIKGEFPEAREAFRLNNPDSDWDVCLPDGEIILCDKTRAECDAFIKRYDFIVEDTCEKFKFYTVKSDGIDRGYTINKP